MHSESDREYVYSLPIGPQHPALKEALHIDFKVEGEVVKDVDFTMGYAHRGIEHAMMRRSYDKNLYLSERICGICNQCHANAYCQLTEALAGVQIPERAARIRTVLAELERIHSHLLWAGVAAHEIGFDTLFHYIWRDREHVMELKEKLTGNRVTNDMNCIGGVRRDVPDPMLDDISFVTSFVRERTNYYLKVFTKDRTIQKRCAHVGVLTRKDAERLGAVGPTARASGLESDVRREAPYAAYSDLKFKVVTDQGCDVLARAKVRLLEILESAKIIEECFPLPNGPLNVNVPKKIMPAEAISQAEAPRGELFYYGQSNGTDVPERVRIRTPTYANYLPLKTMLIGGHIADIPIVVASIDPCISCTDRVTITDEKGTRRLTKEEFDCLNPWHSHHSH